jgi:hypothetical protein
MRLRATVRKVTGKTTHLQGEVSPGGIDVTRVPDPKSVELVEEGGAFYLLRLDDDGQCIADTWHESLEEAKAQANFEYGIGDGDWNDIEPRH